MKYLQQTTPLILGAAALIILLSCLKKFFVNRVIKTPLIPEISKAVSIINPVAIPQTTNKMNFSFKNVFSEATAAWTKLEAIVKTNVAVILTIGAALLSLLNKKGIVDIAELISPEMRVAIPLIDKYLAQAMLILTAVDGVVSITQTPGETDQQFLETVLTTILTDVQNTNVFSQNAFISKCMSILLGLIDGNGQPEYVYDTTIQNAVAHSKMVVAK